MDLTVAWVRGKRLSVQGRRFKYRVRYGGVTSNTTRNPRHALRWACRIKPAIEKKPIHVLGLTFRGQDRFYNMAYRDDRGL